MQSAGFTHHLVDVRTAEEFDTARIQGARLLDSDYHRELLRLPRDANLVFVCHHGYRSQSAAEQFLRLGFCHVFNVAGGIDAWSQHVDCSVPRY
jgi:monothiol glutaredoxin